MNIRVVYIKHLSKHCQQTAWAMLNIDASDNYTTTVNLLVNKSRHCRDWERINI